MSEEKPGKPGKPASPELESLLKEALPALEAALQPVLVASKIEDKIRPAAMRMDSSLLPCGHKVYTLTIDLCTEDHLAIVHLFKDLEGQTGIPVKDLIHMLEDPVAGDIIRRKVLAQILRAGLRPDLLDEMRTH